jgi:hypothetical protein
LREIALGQFQPGRLMVIEGLMHLDDDGALRRRPSMNVYREVVEFRARPGIVGSVLRLAGFMLEDEIGARDVEKKVPAAARAPPGVPEWANAWKIARPAIE